MLSPEIVLLASSSPRRQELLRDMGILFEVYPPLIEEEAHERMTPREHVLHNARLKADWALKHKPERLVLTADTTVALGDQFFDKPRDLKEAKQMLMKFSGKRQKVYTGVCLFWKKKSIHIEHCEVSEVLFKELDEAMVDEYFKIVNPLDRAGAYSIQQGRELIIQEYTGSFNNIVGLPTEFLNGVFQSLSTNREV